MLPIPFKLTIPTAYRDEGNEAYNALIAKADEHLEEWRDELIELAYIYVPERFNSSYLNSLGNMLNADLLPSDTADTKRKKIASAIKSHKFAGTWPFDIKPKIDSIVGGDSSLYDKISDAWWVLADGTEPSSYYWSAFGFNSEQGFDGIILTGSGDELIFPGNVRIDVDDSGLSTDIINQIKLSIAGSVPAYYRIILGYVSSGQFIEYGRIE